jgi:4-hydroxybenzoate polyprenyltransferase
VIKFIFQLIRLKDWWSFITPVVLSSVYFVILIKGMDFIESIQDISLWFISIIGTAAFGFSLNNTFDLEADKKAEKINHLALLPKWKQWTIVLLSLILATTPWFFLNLNFSAVGLLIFQIILLIAYSTPPIRLKNNNYLSIISDSLYSGMIFIIAIVVAGNFEADFFKYPTILFAVTVCTLFFRGLRNIIIHQIADAENDQKAGISTFALRYGKDNSLKVSYGFVIAESIGIIAFTILISLEISYWLSLIIPAFLIYFVLKRFEIKNINKSKFIFTQIINDFYEDILPLIFLILLSFNDYYFVIILIIHLVLFKNKFLYTLVYSFLCKSLFYAFIYRKLLLWLYYNPAKWLYYKAFHNKYIKNMLNKQ